MDKVKTKEAHLDQTNFARRVLEAEARAIERIQIDESFNAAVGLILDAADVRSGSVVVSGLGKSGLIGQKLSATFASTGTPSHFLHPVEALHGDLGRVRRGDLVVLLSYGGDTEEVITLACLLKQDSVPVIAIVGRPDNELASLATIRLAVGEVDEACPMNAAPTASATAMLALGDALALTVSRKRNFSVDQFAKLHPGGLLGRKLMPITEAMRLRAGKNLPMVKMDLNVGEACKEAETFARDGRRVGALVVIDDHGRLAGLFTDADLRRLVATIGGAGLQEPIGVVMKRDPVALPDTALVRDAVHIAREYRFDEIPVVDGDRKPVGLIDVQDLIALKVIEG